MQIIRFSMQCISPIQNLFYIPADLSMSLSIRGKMSTKDGDKYYKITNVFMDSSIEGGHVDLYNLFNGHKLLGKN